MGGLKIWFDFESQFLYTIGKELEVGTSLWSSAISVAVTVRKEVLATKTY